MEKEANVLFAKLEGATYWQLVCLSMIIMASLVTQVLPQARGMIKLISAALVDAEEEWATKEMDLNNGILSLEGK